MRPKSAGLYVLLTRGTAVALSGLLLWLAIAHFHKRLASSQLPGPGPKDKAPSSLNVVEQQGQRVLPHGTQTVAKLQLPEPIGNVGPSAETPDTPDEPTATAVPVPDPDAEQSVSRPQLSRPPVPSESSSPSGNMFIVPLAPIGGLAATAVVPTGVSNTTTAGSNQSSSGGQNSAGGPTSTLPPSVVNPPGTAPSDPGPGPIVTPEPGTITLLSSGVVAMWFIRKRWKR